MDNASTLVGKSMESIEGVTDVGPMIAVNVLIVVQESQDIFRDKGQRYVKEPSSSSKDGRSVVSRMKDRDRDHSSVEW